MEKIGIDLPELATHVCTLRNSEYEDAGPGRPDERCLPGPFRRDLVTRVKAAKPRGREGDLATYACEHFEHEGATLEVYRKGSGPAVIVLSEIPGISPRLLGFADQVVALGCSAVLPNLFGTAGRDPHAGGKLAGGLYMLRSVASVCISREFSVFAAGKSSPVVNLLRRLAAAEHARCGGNGVGVVGMCISGGFALAMATEPSVLVPVLSQPSLPLGLTQHSKRSIDCSTEDLQVVAERCARQGLTVLGLRFRGDPLVPEQRFGFLRERLGDSFVCVELNQADGHPDNPMRTQHAVLTAALVDEPGEPTRAALDRVLELLRSKLLA